jgi:8-oxo-dGTP pyrophosphatase MutT (NUDIX family)
MMLATIESDAFEQRALDYLRSEPPGILDPKGNPTGDHELEMDGRPFVMASLPKPAAVLVPIVMHADEPTVLLTERASNLRDHSGQIAFPGGKIDADDPSPLDTALREADEEIGLDRRLVRPLGYLDSYLSSSGYIAFPAVGVVTPRFELTLNRHEVADVFEVPLEFLLDTRNHRYESAFYRGRMRHYWAMPYGERFIWGATAGMLVTFQRLIRGPHRA